MNGGGGTSTWQARCRARRRADGRRLRTIVRTEGFLRRPPNVSECHPYPKNEGGSERRALDGATILVPKQGRQCHNCRPNHDIVRFVPRSIQEAAAVSLARRRQTVLDFLAALSTASPPGPSVWLAGRQTELQRRRRRDCGCFGGGTSAKLFGARRRLEAREGEREGESGAGRPIRMLWA